MARKPDKREAVWIEGARTPFLKSLTHFTDFSAYDLGRIALSGLISKTGLNGDHVDHIYFGNVIQDIHTSNIAREIGLAGGLPYSVPATTLSMACISSNAAVTSAMDSVRSGIIDCAIAGGTDVMSDIPIRFRKKFRQKLLETQKYRKSTDWLRFFKGLRPNDLLPEIPAISEFSTGVTMGQSCDRMCAKYGISREEQDDYAMRSHQLARKASAEGLLEQEIVPVNTSEILVMNDNGIREDTDLEKLSALRPAFTRPHGTITAGNASFLTDGASAGLIMEKEFALQRGYFPKAILKSYSYTAQRPDDELLIGPAYAVPRVLHKMNLKLEDIDVFEFHEAFAGQVLTVLKTLGSRSFADERLNQREAGTIPLEKLNQRGGSLSIGHPFAATGVRLLTTAINRLYHEGGRYALIASCAAGGQGHAMIVERFKE